VEEALDEIGGEEEPVVESLAELIARRLSVGHQARRVDVEIRAHFPLTKRAPLSGKPSQELYTLIGRAVATPDRCVRLVGVDFLSVERDGPPDFPVHRTLLGAGAVIVEGLDLSAVRPGPYTLVCLPLKVVDGDGAPARAALIEP